MKTEKYHPIFYFEHPFTTAETKVTRYRSKGHHTNGFNNRDDAVNEVKNMSKQLDEQGYIVVQEIENDLVWDGIGVPSDNQLR